MYILVYAFKRSYFDHRVSVSHQIHISKSDRIKYDTAVFTMANLFVISQHCYFVQHYHVNSYMIWPHDLSHRYIVDIIYLGLTLLFCTPCHSRKHLEFLGEAFIKLTILIAVVNTSRRSGVILLFARCSRCITQWLFQCLMSFLWSTH